MAPPSTCAEDTPLLTNSQAAEGGISSATCEASPKADRDIGTENSGNGISAASRCTTVTLRRRHWGGAALAGMAMFALAGVGLFAIFNAIQGATDSVDQSMAPTALQALLDNAAAAEGSRHSGTRSPGSAKRQIGRSSGSAGPAQYGEARGGAQEGAVESPKRPQSSSRQEQLQQWRHEGERPSVTIRQWEENMKPDNSPEKTEQKPNVIFIMVDDMGWNDIGYQSTDLYQITPNLDKLAAQGVKLSNYYTMSICTPARASMMTGRYPVRYGLQYNVIQPGAPWGLPLTEKLMPEYMKDSGYENHMVGKWHLGSYTSSHCPYRRGFDTYLGYLNDEERYWTHQSWTAELDGNLFFDFGFGNETGYYDIIDRNSSTACVAAAASTTTTSSSSSCSTCAPSGCYAGKYSTTIFNDRATEIIQSKTPYDEEPLFLYLAHQAVHDPLGLPNTDAFTEEEWKILDGIRPTEPIRKKFAKVLMYLDKTIGNLVETLEEGGWMDNTIIIVASDNGGCPVNGGTNYPLRGLKHSYWEGGNKVPSFVYSKSHIPEEMWGTTYDGLMHVTDWVPTITAAVGGELTGMGGSLDGVNHWDYIVGATSREDIYSPRAEVLYNFDPYILWSKTDAIGDAEYPLPQGAFRSGKWKLLLNAWCSAWYTFDKNVTTEDPLTDHSLACQDMGACSTCGQSCVGVDNYTDWLYNLEDDPREEINLIHDYPDVALELRTRAKEIAFEEWEDAGYQKIDTDAYVVWSKNGWWMLPWYGLVDEFVDDDSSSSSST